jgi:CRP-like cAMP-binding protein
MRSKTTDYDVAGAVLRSPWFQGLPDSAHRTLTESAHVKSYRRNSYLYTIGEASNDVYCIVAGRVRLLLSSALGQEFAIRDLEPEAWLGEQFLASDLPTTIDARIIEPTSVITIPRAVILALGDLHAEMYKNIFLHHMKRSRGIYRLLIGMAFYPLRSRLAGRFLALVEEHGQKSDNGVTIDMQLSQSDFAQLSLGSRQRINKILSEWREEGIIELQANQYLIRDLEALRGEMELKDHDE